MECAAPGADWGPGSVFGEERVFQPGPHSATVEAVTDVSVRLVTRKMLDEGLGRDSWFGAFVIALANRLVPADARPDLVAQPSNEIREARDLSSPLCPSTAALLECPPTARAGGW